MPDKLGRHRVLLHGGMDENQPSLSARENLLLNAVNVEHKETGTGYRRLRGYVKWDTNEVTDATYVGTGPLRGVAFFNNTCYAARNTSNDNKLAIFKSTGSGWTTVKTGLNPNGTYEFQEYKYASVAKLYGVSGENKAFSIDTSHTYAEITTGLGTDKPSHIATHRNRLWLSYLSSLMYSDVGDPTAWVDWGALAGEISMKGDITAITPTVGGSLASFSRNQLTFLSGTGAEDTLSAEYLVDHGNPIGGYANTVKQLGGRTVFLDDQGVTELSAVQEYGNFRDAAISGPVYQTVQSNKGTAVSSCVVRSKNQYRLFFSNGLGLIFSFHKNKVLGVTKLSFPDVVRVVWSGEDSSGDELILFGSDDGYIYEMESGNSFGGATLNASVTTAFSPCRAPRNVKRFKRAIFDISSVAASSLFAKPLLRLDGSPQLDANTLGINSASAYLGSAILGQATLGSLSIQEGRIDMPAYGDYVAMQVYSSGTTGEPWEIDGVTYEYHLGKPRR